MLSYGLFVGYFETGLLEYFGYVFLRKFAFGSSALPQNVNHAVVSRSVGTICLDCVPGIPAPSHISLLHHICFHRYVEVKEGIKEGVNVIVHYITINARFSINHS